MLRVLFYASKVHLVLVRLHQVDLLLNHQAENLRESHLVVLEMKLKLEVIEEHMLVLCLVFLLKLFLSARLIIPLSYWMKLIKLVRIAIMVILLQLYQKSQILIRIILLRIITFRSPLICQMSCLLLLLINLKLYKGHYLIEWKLLT